MQDGDLMTDDISVRVFRDELNREWEVRAVRDNLTERRMRLLPRPELANGWLLFRLGEERRRLAPLPPGWFVATDVQLTRWCDDAEPAARVVAPVAETPERQAQL
jgi:hypothetical protein